MDPNECLKRIRELVAEGRQAEGDGYQINQSVATGLVALAEALDEWLSKGGFLPTAWSVDRPRSDGTPRMTIAQRDALWKLCGGMNVPFREDDYHPAFDLPPG